MTSRRFFAIALLATSTCAVGAATTRTARADEPSPERLKSAAEEYDKGRRAYLANDFEQAGTHFENAWRDAPRAEALRSAIRARASAKQPARAATLASFAQAKYPGDSGTAELAKKTLDELGPGLHALGVKCAPECAVLVDGRLATLAEGTQQTVYLEPGAHDVVVAWTGDRSHKARVVGKPGGKEELVLQAPAERPKIPPPVDTRTTPSPQPTPDAPKESSKPLPPVVFFVAGGLTLVAGGATVWSGIDTINNPGQDAVRRDCVGQDESCPTYQKGRDAQLRTNVLIGATAGLGVVTAVIGVFFTRWGGDATAKKTGAAPTVLPFVQVGGDARHAPAPSGGGLQGTF